ncbi:MAG: aromatic amino acid ammonia-lyase [Oligoflexia bacterium]|nr:aromatic amino acid ammonia-lyase [Oligoflexia bacterium]
MLSIDHRKNLSLDEIVSVAYGANVKLSPATASMLRKRRAEIVNQLRTSSQPAYGFNRGFGHNVAKSVPAEKLAELQLNLVRSHAAGIGEAAPPPVVRATMLLRAQSLARGYSGVRPELVQQLLVFLNAGITPFVPTFGSVGASGDLAPLSHIALALIGEGSVFDSNGRPTAASAALRKCRIRPITLEMKEGLALTNGVQFSNAFACLALSELWTLLKQAAVNTALVTQVMLASDDPFLAALHELRPHPGAKEVARWIWKLCQDSPIREFHRDYAVDGAVQDPYNIRCAAQILGACHDLLSEAEKSFLIEANSVTDNPLILPEKKRERKTHTCIVSGGHFHGMPIATKLFHLIEAMSIIAKLSNQRCARFVDEARNRGLGSGCVSPTLSESDKACSSGMMLAEYVSAALTNVIWGAAMPSHLFSISTDAGQEDHVSMSAGLAARVWQTLPRLAECLALELAFCSQAASIRKVSEFFPSNMSGPRKPWPKSERRLSPVCERLVAQVQTIFPVVRRDRAISSNMQLLAQSIRAGELNLAL